MLRDVSNDVLTDVTDVVEVACAEKFLELSGIVSSHETGEELRPAHGHGLARVATRYDRCTKFFLSACASAAVVMFGL